MTMSGHEEGPEVVVDGLSALPEDLMVWRVLPRSPSVLTCPLTHPEHGLQGAVIAP